MSTALSQPAKWEKVFWPVVTALVFLTVWHFAVRWTGSKIFPSPLDVEKGMAELAEKGLLLKYIGDSLRRVGAGFSLAMIFGIPLGLVLGWYPAASRVVNPVIQMLRPISPLAWIPIAIIWFGVGDTSAIYLIFLGAFFPIVVASSNGVRNVPSIFRRAARNFGLSPAGVLTRSAHIHTISTVFYLIIYLHELSMKCIFHEDIIILYPFQLILEFLYIIFDITYLLNKQMLSFLA